MLIRDLLNRKDREVFSVHPDNTVKKAVELMNEKHIGALMVMSGENVVVGIVTERDILVNFENLSNNTLVSEIMTGTSDLIIVHDDDTLEYSMNIFTNNKIRHLPVFLGNSFQGIISIGDAVKCILTEQQSENKLLEDYITGVYPYYT